MYFLLKFGKFHVCLFTNSKQGLKLQIVGVQKVIFTFLYPAPEFLLVCMSPNGHATLWHGVSNFTTVLSLATGWKENCQEQTCDWQWMQTVMLLHFRRRKWSHFCYCW